MANEADGEDSGTKRVATEDKIQTEGRQKNGARPLTASKGVGGAERYPSARPGVDRAEGETRSFDPRANAPTPPQGAGDGSATSQGFEGAQGDPAEGKR